MIKLKHLIHTTLLTHQPSFNEESLLCVIYALCISHNISLQCTKCLKSIAESWKNYGRMNNIWWTNVKYLESLSFANAKSATNLSWWVILGNCVRHWDTKRDLKIFVDLTSLFAIRLYLCLEVEIIGLLSLPSLASISSTSGESNSAPHMTVGQSMEKHLLLQWCPFPLKNVSLAN